MSFIHASFFLSFVFFLFFSFSLFQFFLLSFILFVHSFVIHSFFSLVVCYVLATLSGTGDAAMKAQPVQGLGELTSPTGSMKKGGQGGVRRAHTAADTALRG